MSHKLFGMLVLLMLATTIWSYNLMLKPKALITSQNVLLKDVTAYCDYPGYSAIKDSVVYVLPYSQRYANFTEKMLGEWLKQKKISNLSMNGGVTLLRWAENYLNENRIKTQAEGFIKSAYADKAELKIVFTNIPKIIIPADSVTLRFSIHPNLNIKGSVALLGEIYHLDKNISTFNLIAKISFKANTFVLLKSKKMHEAITEADIKVIPGTVSWDSGLATLDQIVGKQARTYLAANRIIISEDLKETPLIKKNDEVEVTVQNGIINLNYKAIAKKDGYLSDYIPCENIQSKQIFVAKIIEKNRVLINLEGK